MEVTLFVVTIFSVCVASFVAVWQIVTFFINRKTQSNLKAREEERNRIEKNHSYVMKAIGDCDEYNKSLEKRVRVLEAQQVSKGEVQIMLSPVEQDVTELKENMRIGFKEIKDDFRAYQQTNEANTRSLISAVGEITGLLRAGDK